jgi:hypothetical protein
LTSIRDIQSLATHVRNAQTADIPSARGERVKSDPKQKFLPRMTMDGLRC